jgi:hypothetical protein
MLGQKKIEQGGIELREFSSGNQARELGGGEVSGVKSSSEN